MVNFNCKSQFIGGYYESGVVFYADSSIGSLVVNIVDIPNQNLLLIHH